jgi:hypothetical protein
MNIVLQKSFCPISNPKITPTIEEGFAPERMITQNTKNVLRKNKNHRPKEKNRAIPATDDASPKEVNNGLAPFRTRTLLAMATCGIPKSSNKTQSCERSLATHNISSDQNAIEEKTTKVPQ